MGWVEGGTSTYVALGVLLRVGRTKMCLQKWSLHLNEVSLATSVPRAVSPKGCAYLQVPVLVKDLSMVLSKASQRYLLYPLQQHLYEEHIKGIWESDRVSTQRQTWWFLKVLYRVNRKMGTLLDLTNHMRQ